MWQQPELIGRTADLDYIRQCAAGGVCCSVVGISNLGKSALLRRLCNTPTPATASPATASPATTSGAVPAGAVPAGAVPAASAGTFVYVDCNAMPERTPHALFTAAWHALTALSERHAQTRELREYARQLYGHLIESHSPLSVALHFEEGVGRLLETIPQPLVLCFDEFDEPYLSLEPQTFLNLRALKDRHGAALSFVTATERELARLTTSREQGEFYELIGPRVRFVHFWEPDETRRFCEHFAAREHASFAPEDGAFVQAQAGGHPGMSEAVCYALAAAVSEGGHDPSERAALHAFVGQRLASDEHLQGECAKVWSDLEADEREALLHFSSDEADYQGEPAAWRGLRHKFIVAQTSAGPQLFARAFAEYVRRRRSIRQPQMRGVYIDVDAGAVWVNDQALHDLTDLEYRLLLYLYGRLDRVCDKYAIVEAVWGQEYVDKVDDGRIEKLVSRVRQKIEPDAAHPSYLLSLRGRGYKLVR